MREVRISINGLPQRNIFFSYLISPDNELFPPNDNFTDSLEEDRRVFEDKCENIGNSLSKLYSSEHFEGWDAKPTGGSVRDIPHPSLS